MIFDNQTQSTVVQKLKLHHNENNAANSSWRLQNLLNRIDLRPAGLPASAIFYIGKLQDPLPGKLNLQKDDARIARSWQQAVGQRVDQLLREARHPLREEVSPNAEAVVFNDRSELLACLAGDFCSGRIHSRWWWQSYRRSMDTYKVVITAWIDAPEFAPAALNFLALRGNAVSFINAMTNADATRLLTNIMTVFALHDIASAWSDHSEFEKTRAGPAAAVAHAHSAYDEYTPARVVSKAANNPPWQRWVPASAGLSFAIEKACLLGIGLMLQRAPAAVRTPAFAQELREWLSPLQQLDPARNVMREGVKREDVKREGVMREDVMREGVKREDVKREDVKREHDGADSAAGESRSTRLQPDDIEGDEREGLTEEQYGDQQRPLPPTWVAEKEAAAQPDERRLDEIDSTTELSAPPGSSLLSDNNDPERIARRVDSLLAEPLQDRIVPMFDSGAAITTELGGLFYLINVGLALRLYGDFTLPAGTGIALSLWDFIHLVGRRLLTKAHRSDPIWKLLARLANRSGREPPGEHFKPPDEWRLPVAWLEPFQNAGRWRWSCDGGRLRVYHAKRFLIVDVAMQAGGVHAQLEKELKRYRAITDFKLERRAATMLESPIPSLESWLAWLVPYLRARLHLALGTKDHTELSSMLFQHRAEVRLTAAHIALKFSLEQLPIAIRLAGLDRDPGWVPAAGRYIAFRFED